MLADILQTLVLSAPGVAEYETLVSTPMSAALRVRVNDNWYVVSMSRDGGPADEA